MNKNVIAFVSFFFIVAAFGQTKKLTLEDGVLQQYRAFRPDQVLGFQWIPENNKFVYFEELGKKLMVANPNDTKGSELVSLSEVNNALKCIPILERKRPFAYLLLPEQSKLADKLAVLGYWR